MSRKPTDDAWDICDDFFEPLAEMFLEWAWNRFQASKTPVDETQMERNYAESPAACWGAYTNAARGRNLVQTWLEVNVSCELADRVMQHFEAIEAFVLRAKGEWPDVGWYAFYLKNLARVLRQRQGKSISKTELESDAEKEKAQADNFRGPFTVAELTNGKRKGGPYRKGLLGVTRSTLYARKKKDPGMFREGIGGLFVHKSLLPNR